MELKQEALTSGESIKLLEMQSKVPNFTFHSATRPLESHSRMTSKAPEFVTVK